MSDLPGPPLRCCVEVAPTSLPGRILADGCFGWLLSVKPHAHDLSAPTQHGPQPCALLGGGEHNRRMSSCQRPVGRPVRAVCLIAF